jgi:hypothetical protein
MRGYLVDRLTTAHGLDTTIVITTKGIQRRRRRRQFSGLHYGDSMAVALETGDACQGGRRHC